MKIKYNNVMVTITEEDIQREFEKYARKRLTPKLRSTIISALATAQIQERARNYIGRGGDATGYQTQLENSYYEAGGDLRKLRNDFIKYFEKVLDGPMPYIIEEFYHSYEAAFGKSPPLSLIDELTDKTFDVQLIVELKEKYHRNQYYASLRHPVASGGLADEEFSHRNSLVRKSKDSEKNGQPTSARGADNMLALFNSGWHAKAYAYGVWEPTKSNSQDSGGRVIRSRKDFSGLHYVEKALRAFNANSKDIKARLDPKTDFIWRRG